MSSSLVSNPLGRPKSMNWLSSCEYCFEVLTITARLSNSDRFWPSISWSTMSLDRRLALPLRLADVFFSLWLWVELVLLELLSVLFLFFIWVATTSKPGSAARSKMPLSSWVSVRLVTGWASSTTASELKSLKQLMVWGSWSLVSLLLLSFGKVGTSILVPRFARISFARILNI